MKASLFILVIALASTEAIGQEKMIPQVVALRAPYEAKIKRDVLDPYGKNVVNLVAKYRDELNRELSAAQGSNGLEDAVALKAELALTEGDKTPPRFDEAGLSKKIKKLRDTFRTELDRLDQERERKWQPYRDEFARSLDPLVGVIERQGNVEDALTVKSMVEGLRTPAMRIVGKWNTELTDGTKAVWRFGKDFTFNNENLRGKFTYKSGTYTVHRLFDWEVNMVDENTFEGVCTKGKVGLLVHGKRIK